MNRFRHRGYRLKILILSATKSTRIYFLVEVNLLAQRLPIQQLDGQQLKISCRGFVFLAKRILYLFGQKNKLANKNENNQLNIRPP